MNNIIVFILLLCNFVLSSVLITGRVTDENNIPIPYANVYIKDTFDGTSSNDKGQFSFITYESIQISKT